MTGSVRQPITEQKRKRRAALLALAATAFLTFVFLMLVWTPVPPEPEATGYLLLELGPGAPLAGEETPASVPEPVPEAPPLAQPVEQPDPPPLPTLPAAPETPVEQAVEPAPTPARQPVADAPSPEPEPTPRPQESPPPSPPPAAPPAPEPVQEPGPAPETAPVPFQPQPSASEPQLSEVPAGDAPPAPEPVPEAPGIEPAPVSGEVAPSPAPPAPVPGPASPSPIATPAPAPPSSVTPPGGGAPGVPGTAPPPLAPAPPVFAPPPPAPSPPQAAGAPAPQPLPAASPQEGGERGGAIGPGEKPYKIVRLRPILVSMDNSAAAFPQWGLEWAVQVHEVPVEGGITRLLVCYEGGEKGRMGPVRSARPYILRLAGAMGAVLLHVGGSPEALAMIERNKMVTFDGLFDPLFKRDPKRSPPHNTYVEGPQVRQQLHRLRLERKRTLSGKAYRPPEDAPTGERVEVRYAPDYVSAFRYDGRGYAWYRNGRLVRGSGAVRVTAVAVLRVDARVVDSEGRLEVDLSKGHGALYIEGRRIPLVWRVQGGLVLEDASGRPLDLTPYRTWFLWVPPWARLR